MDREKIWLQAHSHSFGIRNVCTLYRDTYGIGFGYYSVSAGTVGRMSGHNDGRADSSNGLRWAGGKGEVPGVTTLQRLRRRTDATAITMKMNGGPTEYSGGGTARRTVQRSVFEPANAVPALQDMADCVPQCRQYRNTCKNVNGGKRNKRIRTLHIGGKLTIDGLMIKIDLCYFQFFHNILQL